MWFESSLTKFKPIYFRIFEDNCFVVFRETTHIKQFHTYINKPQQNWKFIVEMNRKKVTVSRLDIRQTRFFINHFVLQEANFYEFGTSLFQFQFSINSITDLIRRAHQI